MTEDRNGLRAVRGVAETKSREDWTEPRSPEVPDPTYWPAIAALTSVVLLFGFLTSWVISVVGLIGFAISLYHWIGELNSDN